MKELKLLKIFQDCPSPGFWALILIAAGLLFDLPSIFGVREVQSGDTMRPLASTSPAALQNQPALQGSRTVNTNATTVLAPMMPEQREYLKEAYGNAVKEIRMRLEQESTLFAFKFAVVGSILALLFKEPPKKKDPDQIPITAKSACFLWAAVITCGLIDNRIQFHQDVIGVLGSWIHVQVEPIMLGNAPTGWETYWDQHNSLLHWWLYPLLRLNTTLLTFVLFTAATYVSSQCRKFGRQDDEKEKLVFKCSRVCCCMSLFVFLMVSVHFHRNVGILTAYLVVFMVGVGFAAVSKVWNPKVHAPRQGPPGTLLMTALLGVSVCGSGCHITKHEAPNSWSGNVFPEPSSELQNKSAAYLGQIMDKCHDRFWVYADGDAAGNHFVCLARMSNRDDNHETALAAAMLPPMNLFCRDPAPHSGSDCIEACFRPSSSDDWGAWYFMNGVLTGSSHCPEPNWGSHGNAGWDLSGATKLSFWARGKEGGERVEFFAFGVGRDPDAGIPIRLHPDGSAKRTLGFANLTREWQRYAIPLQTSRLDYVLGGFGWAASSRQTGGKNITFYLDDIAFDLPRLSEPRFLVSYETEPTGEAVDRVLKNTAYTYDNSLALMAFLAVGAPMRSKSIADAFVNAQDNDRVFADGSLRNAYQGGDWRTPPGWFAEGKPFSARLPGFTTTNQDSECRWAEDLYSVSRDTGNMAWAMLGLLAYHEAVAAPGERTRYLDSAERIGEWVEHNCASTNGSGGYTGGYSVGKTSETKETFKATEHNIDLYAAFERLYLLTRVELWNQRAEHARDFVLSMWDKDEGKFWTGTKDDGVSINKEIVPLDVQAWALLALRKDAAKYIGALKYAENKIKRGGGYDFSIKFTNPPASFNNRDMNGVWYEGTAHMALAYKLAADFVSPADPAWQTNANTLLTFLEGKSANGGLLACEKELWTGILRRDGSPWTYYSRKHVGATAWLVLAECGFNPFWPEQKGLQPR